MRSRSRLRPARGRGPDIPMTSTRRRVATAGAGGLRATPGAGRLGGVVPASAPRRGAGEQPAGGGGPPLGLDSTPGAGGGGGSAPPPTEEENEKAREPLAGAAARQDVI